MAGYARLPRLTEPPRATIEVSLERLAELLGEAGEEAVVQCTIAVDEEARRFRLDVGEGACELTEAATDRPDLEIITGRAAWQDIAEGELSPLEAFTDGRLRIRGDVELGVRLLRSVAADGGAVTVCGE